MIRAILGALLVLTPLAAFAQSCPAPLASARRLVLVVADDMTAREGTMRLFERGRPGEPWRALGAEEPALLGKGGMGWSYFFRAFARKGEPIKVEGDKRVPAGIYNIGKSFGLRPSNRANYLHLTEGTTCVNDLSSPDYNTITTREKVGSTVHGENMWRVWEYRRGLLVDYPADAKARAGSCIFIHVRLPNITGTGGCVALPEPRVEMLQNFSAGGAAIAILPRQARDRFKGCLPD